MKKLIAALLLIISLTFSIGQGQALAAESCENVLNQGSATIESGWFTQPTATIGWYKGTITTDVKYDVCTPTAVIRVNGNDWNKLVADGKVDGLRYEVYAYADKDGNYQNFLFRQIQNGKPQTITAAQFRE
ncbi:hypothetical protein I8748_12425 [Nostoc sp. CENA67]|uniref:Uncharacterized protein n=1 Tax=Amazonocrinis nigriterrae CENA67 TaxID=2794033 RepID=A0A8J7HNL2_9NOST|nr:hypothetical protein [Amazonocrinis nigriterrae]MBH8562978.1 hypothetical protein [Amazonocrinis nigriterrae CENA67]